MKLHNVKLWKRSQGLLESIDLQGDGTAIWSGDGDSLMVTISVNEHFPSAWDAVGYTYSFVGYQVDNQDNTEHTHPRLYYFGEEDRSNPRRVQLTAVEQG